MNSKVKIISISSIAFLCMTSLALAKSVTCDFTSWKGAKDEGATISWIGTGFSADEEKGTIVQIWPDGKSEPIAVEVTPIAKFTTFSYRKSEVDINGKSFPIRYGYRLYKNGKCDASLTSQGYVNMHGYGRVKK